MADSPGVLLTALSIEELVVADLLSYGYSSAKICEQLNKPAREVKALSQSIYAKLGVKTRKEFDEKRPAMLSSWGSKV
jgi:DNA-binding CsgD family transcriptional regulator